MMHFNSWQFDPVRGDYRPAGEATQEGTSEISAIDEFHSKTILLLGATGFVGKVLLALVLERFPELKHLVILVRPKKNVSGEQRFYSEILESAPLQSTVDQIGVESVRKKVSIVEGDLSLPMCGIQAEQLARLTGQVDVVINMAGLVEFGPPLIDSLITNVYGIRNLIELVALFDARLVHVSTCYVAGKKSGRISEDTAIAGYYPAQKGADDKSFDVDKELEWCENFVNETPDREAQREGGQKRADHWGWINTYTYTKSMGEQLIARTPGLKYCIVRPAIVETSLEFPFPGWNEGMTTSAPLVLMGGEGVKSWPVRKDGALEIIPVDLIANGILIATAAVLADKGEKVYHLATAADNPVMLPRLVGFLGTNARFKHKHRKEGNKLANLWKTYMETEVVSVDQLDASRKRMRWGLDLIQATFNSLKVALGTKTMNPYLRSLRITRRQIRQQEQTLDMFLPFMIHNTFVFETDHVRRAYDRLTPEDQRRLKWAPEEIDWADYWVNIHTKGIERWIRPMFIKQLRSTPPTEIPTSVS